MNQSVAPVIPLAARRRAPQPPAPRPETGESDAIYSAVAVFYRSEGKREEREWWFRVFGPAAVEMWKAAHPEMAGAVL